MCFTAKLELSPDFVSDKFRNPGPRTWFHGTYAYINCMCWLPWHGRQRQWPKRLGPRSTCGADVIPLHHVPLGIVIPRYPHRYFYCRFQMATPCSSSRICCSQECFQVFQPMLRSAWHDEQIINPMMIAVFIMRAFK